MDYKTEIYNIGYRTASVELKELYKLFGFYNITDRANRCPDRECWLFQNVAYATRSVPVFEVRMTAHPFANSLMYHTNLGSGLSIGKGTFCGDIGVTGPKDFIDDFKRMMDQHGEYVSHNPR